MLKISISTLNFPKISFSASEFAFFDEKLMTRRFSDTPKFRGGASGHDATDCPQVRGCPLPFVVSGAPEHLALRALCHWLVQGRGATRPCPPSSQMMWPTRPHSSSKQYVNMISYKYSKTRNISAAILHMIAKNALSFRGGAWRP